MPEIAEADTVPELVVDGEAEVGEGPFSDERLGLLVWVDIPKGVVHRFAPATGSDASFRLDQAVGAVAPRSKGGYVAAVRSGFALLDDSGRIETTVPVDHGPGIRMNDGKCDRAGRFWAGSMSDEDEPGAGNLYRLDPHLSVTTVLRGVTISNGLAWSPDDSLMYYVDSATNRVDVLDHDPRTGDAGDRRPFAEFPPDWGLPDGMTIDTDGYLWVAFWGGWRIRRVSPSGEVVSEIGLPVSQVSSCAFGGPDLDELYVTSARAGLGEGVEREPHAGGLFRVRPGARGFPTDAFAG